MENHRMLRHEAPRREPIDFERAAALVISKGPADKRETPARDPLSEVLSRFHVVDLIGQGAFAQPVTIQIVETALLQKMEQPFLEPSIRVKVVLDGPVDTEKHAQPISHNRVKRTRRVVCRRVPVAPNERAIDVPERIQNV